MVFSYNLCKGEACALKRAGTWAGGLLHREMSVNSSSPSCVWEEEALSCKLPKAEVLISPLSDPTTGLNDARSFPEAKPHDKVNNKMDWVPGESMGQREGFVK